jgi:hypothetical protein
MSNKNTRSRKWQLTFNNPETHGFTHDVIKSILADMKSVVYYCMADEQAQSPHTHLYIQFATQRLFSTLHNAFPGVHIENAQATAQENRDYITKEGKWAKDEKHGTKIEGTFEEWGEFPSEQQGKRADMDDLVEMVKAGMSFAEIVAINPGFMVYHAAIEKLQQSVLYEANKDKERELRVTYIWGDTGIGKSRYIRSRHKASDIYTVDNYQHPFDSYRGEPVIVFDDFYSDLPISSLLRYLDRYPVKLPARYQDKQALYTTVYFTSNEPLRNQYRHIQAEKPKVFAAFVRRIDCLLEFTADGILERDIQEHLTGFVSLPDDTPLPPQFTQQTGAQQGLTHDGELLPC